MKFLAPHIEKRVLDSKYGLFIVEPLNRGFGNTLGNALRRVLFSSLPGAAITAVRIEGVFHEFSTIPGVREDVIEILFNIKNIKLKLHSREPKLLRLEVQGERDVKAGDIEADSDVEIINPEHHIAALDEGASLKMDLYVENGIGYLPLERERKPNLPIDFLLIDAVFSPVTKVAYKVEETRYEQYTQCERLILEIWTDGRSSPEEALSQGANILVEYFSEFTKLVPSATAQKGIESLEAREDTLFSLPIKELELSVRSENCLLRAGIKTVGELVQKTPEELLKIRNLGKKSLVEIREKLQKLGLKLKEEKSDTGEGGE
ncbi:MAG: DNA-directed RNA polymerase subunit alpha [Synergistetes bacterium]|nr:MAG: DNA-directed RNA polymerase subunit alpha [bacterium 42_11]MBC7331665.1 DNA-directed RNA polymerase subunit alpha [Synergistota bacterium]MDK2872012.1 DNA-directed polymerase subunit alpha [bacterium]